MFESLKKLRAPADRLAFLETALAPQIADAERALQTRKAAERAAVLRSREDDLAAQDVELAKLEETCAKTAKAMDAAMRAARTAEASHTDAYFAWRQAFALRDMTNGRYERALAGLGGDTIATTLHRLRWLALHAANRLEAERTVEASRRPNGALAVEHRRRFKFDGAELAKACAQGIKAVEALADAAVPVEHIEATCATEYARCEAIAGGELIAGAPWQYSSSMGAH